MILDLVVSDGSGVEVCEEVRRWSNLPIIVLSAVGDEYEKVRALDAGADDYVTKPFRTDELTARIRAALRRRDSGDGSDPLVRVGPVTRRSRGAARDPRRRGGPPDAHRVNLLRVFAAHRGKLVTRRALLQEVWGLGYGEETHYLRVHVAHIRRKLERDSARPEILLTDAGVGYRLGPER
jgi:two-component system KDP operon response regulator KdpE